MILCDESFILLTSDDNIDQVGMRAADLPNIHIADVGVAVFQSDVSHHQVIPLIRTSDIPVVLICGTKTHLENGVFLHIQRCQPHSLTKLTIFKI